MTGFSFFSGKLADRLGVGKTTLQGHLAVGVCTFAAALVPSFIWGCVIFFLAGLGYSFLNPSSSKGVMAWFHSDERATAMGTKQTGVPAGGVVTAMLAPQLVLLIGWRGALAALGIINFLFGFLFSLSLARSGQRKRAAGRPPNYRAGFATSRSIYGNCCRSVAPPPFIYREMALITYVPLYCERRHGVFRLLGEPSAGIDSERRGGRPDRLGRRQRSRYSAGGARSC